MAEQNIYTQEQQVVTSREKGSLVKQVASAVVFLGSLGAATGLNMAGYVIATFVFGLLALISLAIFLGALRSDN